MTDIVDVPAAPVVPPFPALGSANFNDEAYAAGSALSGLSEGLHAIGAATKTNATAAHERAVTATEQASYAADSAVSAMAAATTATDKAAEAAASAIAASKRNLGDKAVEPTTDNQGAPLRAGAEYYDTTLNKWRVWTGAAWGDGISAVAGVSSLNGRAGDLTLKTVAGQSLLGSGDIPGGSPEIIAPTNTSPANGAASIQETPTLTGSTYYEMYGAAQTAIQVQVHTSADFTAPAYSSGDQPAGTSFTLPAGVLQVSKTYYWRMRYKSARGTYSDWSAPTSFATAAQFNSYIATPVATPANFGGALEGGFYAGMVWNELVQSATSTTISTGSKTFTVPSMAGAPIVYAGQQLEVRSRANPANKMVGTVTGAVGTGLTLNVTSVGGSGTFADWSIMSRYRVIVAPKASGENAGVAIKNANTALPTACQTLTEGLRATQAMRDADTSVVYPAAHWARGLNIGGRTDWYIPARDELELCWRNLKPTTDANYTTANRPTSATPNYANGGSYGDTANTHGLNNNSAPAGAAYTSGAPAQTAASAFRTGGAEAFEYSSAYYWSSSEYSASSAWNQYWSSSFPGYQFSSDKTNAYRVRAVRRSII